MNVTHATNHENNLLTTNSFLANFLISNFYFLIS
jgi:hypothetical protein